MKRGRPSWFSRLAPAALLAGAAATAVGAQTDDPAAALRQALVEAETALSQGEMEIAESRYHSALLEGWLLLGALEAREGRYPAARSAYEAAARSAVETRRAQVALAVVQLSLGEADEAALVLRDVVGRHPQDLVARRLLARALVATGRLDQAIQELEEIRAAAPEDLESLYALASAYLSRGDPSRAEDLFSRLLAERPTPEAYVLVGRTYRDHGRHVPARQALERALELEPRARRAHFYLGILDLLEEGRGRMEQARERFEAELRVAPEDPTANLYLGIALVESRRHADALRPLEVAARSDSVRQDALQFLGRAYLGLDRPEEAREALEEALGLEDTRPRRDDGSALTDVDESRTSTLHYQLAQALRRLGREDEAAVHFAAAKESSARLAESSRDLLARYLADEPAAPVEVDPMAVLDAPPADDVAAASQPLRGAVTAALARAYLDLGVLKMRASRFDRAAGYFEEALELEPDSARALASLGTAYFNAGRFERAAAPLEGALALEPGDESLRQMLALAWMNTKRYDRAVEIFEGGPGLEDRPSLQYAYGLALVRSGRGADAEPIFARLLSANADWPELNVVLGQAYAQQGDYEAAARSLSRALELDPTVAEANSTLGEMYLRQGKLSEAGAALRAELERHPEDLRAAYTLAVVLDLDRKPDEALELLDSVLATEPRFADARYLAGKIHLAEGRAERALEQLSVAAELAPRDPNIRYQRGQALQQLGRTDEAELEFDRFRALKDEQRGGDPS